MAEILHAALKWEVMTKCRSGKKNSVERFSSYCDFCGCWGASKWVFGHFVKYLFSYPYDWAEIWHAALKWGVMTKCKRYILAENILGRRYLIFFVLRGVLKMCFLDFINF